jgi:hypothetical protein
MQKLSDILIPAEGYSLDEKADKLVKRYCVEIDEDKADENCDMLAESIIERVRELESRLMTAELKLSLLSQILGALK